MRSLWDRPLGDNRGLRLRRLLARVLPVVVIVGGAGALAEFYALRATHWAVMTDELQTAKLSTSIGERLSLVPRIHGVHYGALAQVYPLVLAPLFAVLAPQAAMTAAHGLNAFLLASAAVPTYLLARTVTRSRPAAVVAAALAAFTPWLVLASTLLTESASYPAFAWALYLVHRTFAN